MLARKSNLEPSLPRDLTEPMAVLGRIDPFAMRALCSVKPLASSEFVIRKESANGNKIKNRCKWSTVPFNQKRRRKEGACAVGIVLWGSHDRPVIFRL